MMSHQIDDIKRRHNARKERLKNRNETQPSNPYPQYDKESKSPNGIHPLFNVQKFIFRLFIAVTLVLVVGILYKQPSTKLSQEKTAVQYALNKEFNFAQVSSWYDNKFGNPLAFFPNIMNNPNKQKTTVAASKQNSAYAKPVIGGTITQSFGTDGQGIYLSTGKNSVVEAVKDGYVTAIENKPKIGKTVIVQHTDNTETWYGKLNTVKVKLYEHVKKGQKIGTVSQGSKQTGSFYFAIKKGKKFVDPIQVIKFE